MSTAVRHALHVAVLAFFATAALISHPPPKNPPQRSGQSIHFTAVDRQLGDYFGIGTYIAKRYPARYPVAISRVRETGADWVREEFPASDLHHATLARYDFSRWDRVVNAEARSGIHTLGLLDYNNTFDLGPDHSRMPHRLIGQLTNQFIDYITAIVTHYRHSIYDWQVWNEPDLKEFWKPHPSAADYAYLLKRAYVAIHSANRQAQVVVGGPSGRDPDDFQFLHQVVENGGLFDIVSMQPYTDYPNSYFLNDIYQLRKFHKPIWFTEVGWAGQYGCSACGTPEAQATRLATIYLASGVSGVRKVFWYDLRDDGLSQSFPDHFGLVEWNFAGKPAYQAFEISHFYLDNATIVGADHAGGGLTLYALVKHGFHYFVAWNNSPDYINGRRFLWYQRPIQVFNYLGQRESISESHVLRLSMSPDSVQYLAPWRLDPPRRLPPGLPIPPGHTK